ncbi:hypothetical protein PENTCL1PPCAC_5224, partial [Pristionchus entomophagus]
MKYLGDACVDEIVFTILEWVIPGNSVIILDVLRIRQFPRLVLSPDSFNIIFMTDNIDVFGNFFSEAARLAPKVDVEQIFESSSSLTREPQKSTYCELFAFIDHYIDTAGI